MKKFYLVSAILAFIFCSFITSSAKDKTDLKASGTYMFAKRDTCNLFMDVYEPTPGSELTHKGLEKPTVLFMFGGGFIGGKRSNPSYFPWFKTLNDNGYRVITIDYRLGLKGVNMSFSITRIFATARATRKAVVMGIEDLFAATSYIVENAKSLGVDPKNIVLSGSSAGAMIAVAAEQEICNSTELSKLLPKGFNYKGLISFAGAIVTDKGKIRYNKTPCPQMFIHGTIDKTVNYKQLKVFNWGVFGSDVLAKICKKNGYIYNIYRYANHSHDMATNFVPTWPEQKRFLEINIIENAPRIIDSFIDDPTVPKWEAATRESLY